MTKLSLVRSLGVALAIASLAGCGVDANLATAALGVAGQDQYALTGDASGGPGQGGHRGGRKGGPDQDGPRHDGPGRGGPMGLFADLDLSADQQAELKAIADKYRPTPPADGQRPERPEHTLTPLLTAATVDVDALKAALAAIPAPPAPPEDNRIAQMTEIRAVLTDAQRAQIIAKLEAAPAPQPRLSGDRDGDDAARSAALTTKLGLTDAQKAAFDAFQSALAAGRPPKPTTDDHAARQAAELAFWKTGDTSGLAAGKPAFTPPAFPVDELVALATSLSAEQRQQFFARGGFGGHEGPRGGHGGPGGMPPMDAPQG